MCDWVGGDHYVGIDIDTNVLDFARQRHTKARFLTPDSMAAIADERFDTIVALAVIEHLPDPKGFLRDAADRLAPRGRIILTTPNPVLDWAHGLGSRFGLFARDSHEEHLSLTGRRDLAAAIEATGLALINYQRFLLGPTNLRLSCASKTLSKSGASLGQSFCSTGHAAFATP